MKKLELNNIYKLLIEGDVEEENEYIYYVCTGFKNNFSILNEFEQWIRLNGREDELEWIEDLDVEFAGNEEILLKHFKKLNSLEAVYYIDQEVDHSKPEEPRKKFTVV